MTDWRTDVENAPKTVPEGKALLFLDGDAIYRATWCGDAGWGSACGQPVCYEPDPEAWCLIDLPTPPEEKKE